MLERIIFVFLVFKQNTVVLQEDSQGEWDASCLVLILISLCLNRWSNGGALHTALTFTKTALLLWSFLLFCPRWSSSLPSTGLSLPYVHKSELIKVNTTLRISLNGVALFKRIKSAWAYHIMAHLEGKASTLAWVACIKWYITLIWSVDEQIYTTGLRCRNVYISLNTARSLGWTAVAEAGKRTCLED